VRPPRSGPHPARRRLRSPVDIAGIDRTERGDPRTGSHIVIEDERGGVAHIATYDVIQSNGVIHVIDRVMPR